MVSTSEILSRNRSSLYSKSSSLTFMSVMSVGEEEGCGGEGAGELDPARESRKSNGFEFEELVSVVGEFDLV